MSSSTDARSVGHAAADACRTLAHALAQATAARGAEAARACADWIGPHRELFCLRFAGLHDEAETLVRQLRVAADLMDLVVDDD